MCSQQVREVVDAFANADVIIDIWGIAFADSLGSNTLSGRAAAGGHLLVGKLFRKPVVKYTADLGPFECRWNRLFARLYLQHAVDLILVRSDVTRRRLSELGVTTPTKLCPDTAFLLEPEASPCAEALSKQKVDSHLVGFSVSHMTARQSGSPDRYLHTMAGLADHIAEKTGARVVLIPNELSDDVAYDDARIAEWVWHRMTRKAQAIVLSGEHTAPQLKGIIGQCDALVAARYHSIVASLSQAIPVLAIGWHDKYVGLLSLVGQERYLCPAQGLDLHDSTEKFDDLWQTRHRIREEISDALPKIRAEILKGGEAVAALCGQRSNGAP